MRFLIPEISSCKKRIIFNSLLFLSLSLIKPLARTNLSQLEQITDLKKHKKFLEERISKKKYRPLNSFIISALYYEKFEALYISITDQNCKLYGLSYFLNIDDKIFSFFSRFVYKKIKVSFVILHE